jgi:membrane fusion protein, hemolysin D
MKLARNVVIFRGSPAKVAGANAFLPAALEIVETPASPAGRAVAATIILIFCFALVWAAFGTIDIVASASGKVVPFEGTKVIQPFETGIVRAIHVRDGQHVDSGELLIELDPAINQVEQDHARADLVASQLEIARLKAALADIQDPLSAFVPPAGATPTQIATEREYLIKQTQEHRAKIQALDRQHDQKLAERATIQATVEKLSAIIPVVQQRVDIRKASSDKEYTSKYQYFEIVQQLVEEQQELIVQQTHLHEVEVSMEAIAESRRQAVAEFGRTLFGQLTEAQRKADGFSYDVAKSQQRINAQSLKAPIDGIVQQLAIHTIGGVVTPAQNLLVVVPLGGSLEIEAMVQNRDIGFVHPGQPVEIKVDTFNFTKYGLLHGEVLSVSRDAIVREKPTESQRDKMSGGEGISSEPKGQELSFAARISLDRTQMQVDDNLINLTPGMAVTAEIKAGSRSVLSYILSPLVRYHQESLRER